MKVKKKNFGMAPAEIKAELILRGRKLTDIADDIGVHRSAVTLVIQRRGNSRRLREVICQEIEKPYKEVWGDDEGKAA